MPGQSSLGFSLLIQLVFYLVELAAEVIPLFPEVLERIVARSVMAVDTLPVAVKRSDSRLKRIQSTFNKNNWKQRLSLESRKSTRHLWRSWYFADE